MNSLPASPCTSGPPSDGDLEMLSHARFALLIHHDDATREFAQDAGAEQALQAARHNHWTVARMADDFATEFQSTDEHDRPAPARSPPD